MEFNVENVMYGLAVALLAGGAMAWVATKWQLTARSAVIAGVLVLLGTAMWPPGEKLNLGLDLRGGTSLLYEVDVPEGQDSREVLRRTVQVLEERVDPAGVRNLQWRIEAGNRIEVQMPLPTPEVQQRRQAYMEAMDAVEDRNVRQGQLNTALRQEGEARQQALAQLVRGVEARQPLLEQAAHAYDRLQAAREARGAAEQERDRIAMAREVAEAEREFEAARRELLATNLPPDELRHVLELQGDHRQQQLNDLVESHPHRAGEIGDLVEVYDAFAAVRGPLDDPNDLIRLLRGSGVLEYRIAVSQEDAINVDELRERLEERGPRGQPADAEQKWFPLDDPSGWADDEAEEERLLENPGAYFAGRNLVATRYGDDVYLLLWDRPDKSITQRDPGWELRRASRTQDPNTGFPAVSFQLNSTGAYYMGQLTSNHIGQPMAIVLDGQVYSAPNINTTIRGNGIITGRFTPAELEYLIRTLQAGALGATLSDDPISVRTVGPTLGQDNLESGLRTAIWALILIALFMMVYYFFAGMVAAAALFANIVVILGVMSTLQAAFTLPGIAGIVLTIGMTVDANVLIFERIREEMRRGADMATSLRLGYEKALSAIIDGNATNLIVCFILGYTATAEVRGFAVTLGVGIIATLFTSVFMSRVILTAYYQLFGARKMHMLPVAFPAIDRMLSPAIRWVAQRRLYWAASIVMIVLSIGFIGARGGDLLDIEFRGGTEVSFHLAEDAEGEPLLLSLPDARERLADSGLEARVVPLGNVDDQFRASQFTVLTTVPDTDRVRSIVEERFGDLLDEQPALAFEGEELSAGEAYGQGLIYPVEDQSLGVVINEPGVEDDVSQHLGGAAMVLRDLTPSVTLEEVRNRVANMRLQPDYEGLDFRPTSQVVGLELDPEDPERYRSVAVISSDRNITYMNNPDVWMDDLASTEWSLVRDALTRAESLERVSNFTPAVARTMAQAAVVALLFSMVAIVAYIWFRFGSLRYSLAAIAALLHDVIITLGLVAVSAFIFRGAEPLAQLLLINPFMVNMALIAALLTIIGYSLNDTIVIFDRIRENRGKMAFATPAIINRSINQTISRTVITSGTTLVAVMSLYIFGGEGLRGFAFALIIGVMVGTYSSIAVAASLLLVGTKFRDEPEAEPPDPNIPAAAPATGTAPEAASPAPPPQPSAAARRSSS